MNKSILETNSREDLLDWRIKSKSSKNPPIQLPVSLKHIVGQTEKKEENESENKVNPVQVHARGNLKSIRVPLIWSESTDQIAITMYDFPTWPKGKSGIVKSQDIKTKV